MNAVEWLHFKAAEQCKGFTDHFFSPFSGTIITLEYLVSDGGGGGGGGVGKRDDLSDLK